MQSITASQGDDRRKWLRSLSPPRRDFYRRVVSALKRRGTPHAVAVDMARGATDAADDSADLVAVAHGLGMDVDDLPVPLEVVFAPAAPPASSATCIDWPSSAVDRRGGP